MNRQKTTTYSPNFGSFFSGLQCFNSLTIENGVKLNRAKPSEPLKKNSVRQDRKPKRKRKVKKTDPSSKIMDTTKDTPREYTTPQTRTLHRGSDHSLLSVQHSERISLSPKPMEDLKSNLEKREPQLIRRSPDTIRSNLVKFPVTIDSTPIKKHKKTLETKQASARKASEEHKRVGLEDFSLPSDLTPIKEFQSRAEDATTQVGDLFDGIHRNLIPKLRCPMECRRLIEISYSVPICYQPLLECFLHLERSLFLLLSKRERLTYRKIRDLMFSQARV